MEMLKVKIQGISPLLMHNGQLADPMNEHSIRLSDAVKSAKKSKTTAAWEAAYKAEFMGGLYLDDKLEPCIPGEVLEATIVNGAKRTKQGKAVTAGIIVDEAASLEYKGPRNAEKLWKDKFYSVTGVRVGQARVMRARPMFSQWSLSFVVQFNPALVNRRDLIKFIETAGAEVGLCDGRPRYGRFEVVQ